MDSTLMLAFIFGEWENLKGKDPHNITLWSKSYGMHPRLRVRWTFTTLTFTHAFWSVCKRAAVGNIKRNEACLMNGMNRTIPVGLYPW